MYLGWKAFSNAAFCKECDGKEIYAYYLKICTKEKDIDDDRVEDDIESFKVYCASRGFHEYRKI